MSSSWMWLWNTVCSSENFKSLQHGCIIMTATVAFHHSNSSMVPLANLCYGLNFHFLPNHWVKRSKIVICLEIYIYQFYWTICFYLKVTEQSNVKSFLNFKGYRLVTTLIAKSLIGFRGPRRPSEAALLNLYTWSERDLPRRRTTRNVWLHGTWQNQNLIWINQNLPENLKGSGTEGTRVWWFGLHAGIV